METDPNPILWKKVSGARLSPEETAAFERWYQEPGNQAEYEKTMRAYSAIRAAAVRENLSMEESWEKLRIRRPTGRITRYLKYAAITLLPLLAGLGYFLRNNPQPAATELAGETKKGVTITLSSGETLWLSESSGDIEDGGHFLSANPETGLTYSHAENFSDSVVRYNEIYVPRGAEFQVRLADGSMIWLNADSHIRYPVSAFFPGERVIELKGEAYFQITKGGTAPLIVKTGGYDIRVTGTEFNVKNYRGGPILTTLVKGSVLIEHDEKSTPLHPGQQALLAGSELEVATVNPGRQIAWKEGQFFFSNTPLEEMLEELARWYDLEVIFRDEKLRSIPFSAWFDRQHTVPEVVRILEATEKIKFDLSEKVLTVTNRS